MALNHALFKVLSFSVINHLVWALQPLSSKHYNYPDLPYQVTGDQGGARGPQAGYNRCNSTTEGPDSKCQTLLLNNLSDFCMWSSGEPNDTVGESEAREFAWCTQPGHGTRIIPAGAITGAQWLYAKNYLQVVGFIDQTKVNLQPNDPGGELDPHGFDEQGNPLGGVVFTNGFGQNSAAFKAQIDSKSPEPSQYTQVIEWVNFIGNGQFCLKMCNPSNPDAAKLCAHVYDEIGCNYNAIANYDHINNTFTVCDSEDMADPGIFTLDGKATTWSQPWPDPVSTIPYQTIMISSSNCQTYASTDLFAAVATGAPSPSSSNTASAGAHTGTAAPGASSKSAPGASGPSSSRTGNSPSPTNSSGVAVGKTALLGVPVVPIAIALIMLM